MGRRFNPKMLKAIAERQCRRPGTRCVCCNRERTEATNLLCGDCLDRLPGERLAEYQARRTRWMTTKKDFESSLHNPDLIDFQVEAGRCRQAIRRGEGEE